MNIAKLTLAFYWFINIELTIGTGGITILIPLKVKGSGKINKVIRRLIFNNARNLSLQIVKIFTSWRNNMVRMCISLPSSNMMKKSFLHPTCLSITQRKLLCESQKNTNLFSVKNELFCCFKKVIVLEELSKIWQY